MQMTTAQMKLLSTVAAASFFERALAHLESSWPEPFHTAGAQRMRQLVELSVARCRAHGAGSQACVVALAELSLAYRRDVYEQDRWVQEILSSEYIDVADKAKRLKTYL